MSRYRKIEVRTWADEKFRRLSGMQPSGQGLWFFLLTGPHTGPIPGLFRAGRAAMAEELDWDLEAFDKAFGEVLGQGMAKADFKARLVWLPNALKHNKPESPNVVRSWRDELDALPECDLKNEAVASISEQLRAFGEPYFTAFYEISRGQYKPSPKPSGKPSPKTMPNQEQEQEQEQERDIPPIVPPPLADSIASAEPDSEPVVPEQPAPVPELAAPAAKTRPTKSKSKIDALDFSSWPGAPNAQVLADWIAMRKAKRAAISQTVVDGYGRELAKADAAGYSVDDCLTESVTRGWVGFKFEWLENARRNHGHGTDQPRGFGAGAVDNSAAGRVREAVRREREAERRNACAVADDVGDVWPPVVERIRA